MCIILTCDKNVRPSDDLIETCFWNNPDGAGLMWVEDGRVQTSKGYMDEDALIAAIASVPLDSPLVIHMRIATSGGVSAATCHPFPVCRSMDALHAENVECNAAVAHNGVIMGVPTNDKEGVSDTVYFVSHAIADMWRNDNKVTRKMRRKISKKAPHNRFAILTESGRVYRIGDGWETVSPGIEASNDSWRYDRWSLWDKGGSSLWGGHSANLSDYDVDPAYSDYIDMLCADCPEKDNCKAFGAICHDVDDYIEEALYGSSGYYDSGYSYYDRSCNYYNGGIYS